MQKRESNYDLLRIICTISVILIHIANAFLKASFKINYQDFGFIFSGNLLLMVILDTLPRFSVQCFVMMSGAFILANKSNSDFKYFYTKSFKNIGVTTIVFSVIYTVFEIMKKAIKILMNKNGGGSVLLNPVVQLILGLPTRHMWFLFMLLGLYLVTPVLLILEEKIKPIDLFGKITWLFLFVAMVSYWSRPYDFAVGWDIGLQSEFLSLFMVGYSLRRWAKNVHRSNTKGIIFIAVGLLVEILLAFLRYREMLNGKAFNGLRMPFDWLAFEGLAPFVVLSSVLIFAGFSLLKVNKDFSRLSSLTFLIYLFHIGVWNIISTASIHLKIYPPQTTFFIPVCVAFVFLISLLSALIYRQLWKVVDKKFNITHRLCKMLKLNST